MRVEVWSDVVCPWCYIGKRRLEDAIRRFEHGDEVEVVWHSFELNPSASPSSGEGGLVRRLAIKYGVSLEQAEAMNDRVTRIADDEGLQFRLDIARPGNTLDAHRLVHLGAEHGLQGAVKERLLAAYQCEGEPIGDRDALARLAVEAGLPSDEVAALLDGDRFTAEVRADEEEAMDMGVSGVPFFVFDRKLAVAGAQPSDVLLDVLERAWAKRSPVEVVAGSAADACGPDGCDVPGS